MQPREGGEIFQVFENDQVCIARGRLSGCVQQCHAAHHNTSFWSWLVAIRNGSSFGCMLVCRFVIMEWVIITHT